MGIVAGDGHVQCVNHVNCRFSTQKNGVDEIVRKVAVGTAVSARLNTWWQGVFLDLQAFFRRLLESLDRCREVFVPRAMDVKVS